MTATDEFDGALTFHAPYKIQLSTRLLTIEPADLNQFVCQYFRDRDVHPRISKLLVVDLYVYNHVFGFNPGVVVQEIQGLEGKLLQPRGTKPASEFKKLPLKGLWHKHFFSAHFMARNIQTGWAKGRIESLIWEMLRKVQTEEGSGPTSPKLARELSANLARQAVSETLDLRKNADELTGEWIVFAKREGLNYYLCLNTHKDGDQVIRERIMKHCVLDFPFLETFLQSEGEAPSPQSV